MNKHFVLFEKTAGHSVVHLLQSASVNDAIYQFIERIHGTDDISILNDGSIQLHYSRKVIMYPHGLAFVEAFHKVGGEWQIRELSDWMWEAEFAEEIFLGENAHEVKTIINLCKPVFHEDFPRFRASAFIWYLEDLSVLVNFYKRIYPFQIEVLKRYRYKPGEIIIWNGDYKEIVNRLYIGSRIQQIKTK